MDLADRLFNDAFQAVTDAYNTYLTSFNDIPYLERHQHLTLQDKSKNEGWQQYERFKRLLDETKYERHQLQIDFHNEMLLASLPIIFGDQFQTHQHVILDRLQVDKMHTEVMLCTARRMGKTAGVCIFAAVFLMALRDVEGVVFAVAQRASNRIISDVRSIIESHREYSKYLVRSNQKEVRIRKPGDSKDCILRAFPAHSTTTLGFGGNMIILDEAAYVKERMFLHTILPVAQQLRTILICISTPCETQNWFTKMKFKKTSKGEPVFKYIDLTLICSECQKLPHSDSIKCKHLDYKRPMHLSSEKRARFESIYEDDSETMTREMFGVSIDDKTNRCFRDEHIDDYMSDLVIINERQTVVYISIDPSGGTWYSMFTISAVVDRDGAFVEVFRGIYSNVDGGFNEAGQLFINAVKKILEVHWLKDAYIVFYPESTLPQAAQTLHDYLRSNFDNNRFLTMTEGSSAGAWGVIKNAKTTEEMIMYFQLAIARRHFKVWKQLMVDTNLTTERMENMHGTSDPLEFSNKMLRRQLQNVVLKCLNPDRADGEEARYKYTGKTGKEPDDLAIAVIMHVYWINVFWTKNKPEYISFQEKIATGR